MDLIDQFQIIDAADSPDTACDVAESVLMLCDADLLEGTAVAGKVAVIAQRLDQETPVPRELLLYRREHAFQLENVDVRVVTRVP